MHTNMWRGRAQEATPIAHSFLQTPDLVSMFCIQYFMDQDNTKHGRDPHNDFEPCLYIRTWFRNGFQKEAIRPWNCHLLQLVIKTHFYPFHDTNQNCPTNLNADLNTGCKNRFHDLALHTGWVSIVGTTWDQEVVWISEFFKTTLTILSLKQSLFMRFNLKKKRFGLESLRHRERKRSFACALERTQCAAVLDCCPYKN